VSVIAGRLSFVWDFQFDFFRQKQIQKGAVFPPPFNLFVSKTETVTGGFHFAKKNCKFSLLR